MRGRYVRSLMFFMKKIIIGTLTLVILIFAFWYFLPQQTYLTFSSQRTDEVVLQKPVEAGDEVEIGWIHSVEHTPWIETFRINEEDHLILTETRFKSYGAGTPEDTDGTLRVEDGFMIITDLHETFEAYHWFHSYNVDYTISINDRTTIETTALPDQTPMEMKVEREVPFVSSFF
ncbi:DUF1850 domain-containing protein [Natribacillus halophilus]|uniref:DUF1850 domain-containing protein n=1 Tax=Natribacillus halophilus TaxID=549003 RepID=A0A1G8KW38_9BACI|nr:DUF1850 domain-containing protein [Natribacillus halophilus]SDI47596.1 hypothetical protein SAMN04488123_102340 [Natribacillus halophilus]